MLNIDLIYNSSAVKKCAAPKQVIVKKDVKSKVAGKKWLDGRLMAKILIPTIEVNLCCLLQDLVPISPELSSLKILPLAYHQAISWPPPWISHLF